MVKTTVLLAVCSGERFLPAQLSSLASQTRKDFTVLYQDDGSADGTANLLNDFSSLSMVSGKEPGCHFGAAGNFFSLLRQSDSDLYFLCDQDDIWEPDKIETLLKAYEETMKTLSPDTPVLIHSDASLIDEHDHPIFPSFFALQGWDPSATDLPRLLVQNNATGCTMLLNRPLRDLVVSHGDPGKMFMHDWFIALTAAAFGKVIFVNQPLIRYRQHGDNAIGASTSSLLQRGIDALRNRDQAKARIRLTYTHAQSFLDAYGDALPDDAKNIVLRYLDTASMSKLSRVRAVRRGGYLMQSPVTRIGQMLFG